MKGVHQNKCIVKYFSFLVDQTMRRLFSPSPLVLEIKY